MKASFEEIGPQGQTESKKSLFMFVRKRLKKAEFEVSSLHEKGIP